MKKKIIFLLGIAVMLAVTGCQKKADMSETQNVEDKAETPEVIKEEPEKSETQVEDVKDPRLKTCKEDNFENSAIYVRTHKEDKLMLNFSAVDYDTGDRSKAVEYTANVDAIEEKTAADEFKSLRFERADNAGATLDVDVYTDPENRMIDKIDMTEYCANGRERSVFYYEDGELVYAYTFKNDLYGTKYEDSSIPGKKCYFSRDVMVKCVLDDEDVNFTSKAYSLSDYENMDEFTQVQYDELEKKMIDTAYAVYDGVRNVPGYAMISGYVGDEYGGVLSHVEMTIRSKALEYERTFETNGDGYFQELIPINEADDYGLVCKYGTFSDATVDDIRICRGTKGYSLGVIYMAEPGKNIHDTNTYLLNANYSSPKKLSEGEYCITFNYEDEKADLKPYVADTKSGRITSDTMAVVKPGKDDVIKYYITDDRGGHSDNPMTYELSGSRGIVRVYDKDGLVAAYNTPVGSAGTVWEVFSIKDGKIIPKNTMYQINVKEPFFN